jgi:hypothetical protein
VFLAQGIPRLGEREGERKKESFDDMHVFIKHLVKDTFQKFGMIPCLIQTIVMFKKNNVI